MSAANTDSNGPSRLRGLPSPPARGSSWPTNIWFGVQCLIALPLLPFLLVGWALCAPFDSRRHDHLLIWVLAKFGPALIAGGLIGLTISYLRHH
jgi:hypothetical protein